MPYSGLLRFLYRDLDDQLQQETAEPDENDDDALDELDNRDFLKFEVRLGLIDQSEAAGQDPLVKSAIEQGAQEQLDYIKDLVSMPYLQQATLPKSS
jgi:hypothetical protein